MRKIRLIVWSVLFLLFEVTAAQALQSQRLENLGKLPIEDLKLLYRTGDVRDGIPLGSSEGVPLFRGLIAFSNRFAKIIWGGKIIEKVGENDYRVYNKFGKGVIADGIAYRGVDKSDSRQSIVVDYGKSKFYPARCIVDLLRRVDGEQLPDRLKEFDGLYIGTMTIFMKERVGYFALDFDY